MITQEKLDELYEKYLDEYGDKDGHDFFGEWRKILDGLGPHEVLSGEGHDYGRMVDSFIELLVSRTGAVVLDNPMWEGNSHIEYLVFFPSKS